MTILVNLFHIFFVVPLLLLLSYEKINWALPYLKYLAMFVFIGHLLAVKKKHELNKTQDK